MTLNKPTPQPIPTPAKPEPAGPRFAYDGLERVIHEKARLSIMTSLAANPEGLLFSDLRDVCGLTDGNLNRHLQVLQEAGFVEVWKSVNRQKRPQTLCRITDIGRTKFVEYLGVLESVVADAMNAAKAKSSPAIPEKRGLSTA